MKNYRHFVYFLLVYGHILALSGCGQSGPLYLPGSPPPIKVAPMPPLETEQSDIILED